MSTTPIETFAVDLATLGPIYPFVGTEKILVLVLFVVWIAFTIWQMRFENRRYERELAHLNTPERIAKALRNHGHDNLT